MAVTIVVRIDRGSFEYDGFPVSLQIRDRGMLIREEHNCARIPPAPSIPQLHSDLHERYSQLGQTRKIEPLPGQTTHVSGDEALKACQTAADSLRKALESWFQEPQFQFLRNQIWAETNAVISTSTAGNTSVPIIFDICTGNEDRDTLLRKLPWNLWDLFKKLKNAEPVLTARVNRAISPLVHPVRILAIFGSSEDGQVGKLKLEEDLRALQNLQGFGAQIHAADEPSRSEIHQLLWQQSWDIFFFAGHSFSEKGHQNGYLQIGSQPVALSNLEADLEQAVNRGLKLAIFNSCDGLGIANYLASLDVPSIIVMREPVPDLVARKFLQYFLEAFAQGSPMYLAVREARRRIEHLETDKDEPCPAASWLPIVCQNPSQPELVWPTDITPAPSQPQSHLEQTPHSPVSNQLLSRKRIALAGIVGLLLLMTGKFIYDRTRLKPKPISVPEIASSPITSLGETILTNLNSPQKQQGSNAFAKGNYLEAKEHFQSSLKENHNDPEAVIYLNNAIANLNPGHPPVRIGVSVPISSNRYIPSEMLRGVAQAQSEINAREGGIHGAKLEVKIADDGNKPDVAKSVANQFANDAKILAVVGHNASQASLAAAPVYQERELVMITPTSFARTLTGRGSYIFRTIPNTQDMATRLAEYVVKVAHKPDIGICYDSQAPDQVSFKDQFIASLTAQGGRLVPLVCDLASPKLNPNAMIQEAIRKGAKGLLLSPFSDRVSKAIQLAQANHGQLPLFSSPTLYVLQTLKEGQADVNGLVLPAAWYPQVYPNSPFLRQARQLWGGDVSWRTATSYDAMQAVIAGLQQSQTRSQLQQVLRNPSFSTAGAGETVRFDPETGDRKLTIHLIEVKPAKSSHSGTGYDFALVKQG